MTTQIPQVAASILSGMNKIASQVNQPSFDIDLVHVLPSGLRFTFVLKTTGNPVKVYSLVEVLKKYMEEGKTDNDLLNKGQITYVNGTGNTFHFWFA